MLAYIRTSLAMLGLGTILAGWTEHPAALIEGIALTIVGVLALCTGVIRFLTGNRRYLRFTQRRK